MHRVVRAVTRPRASLAQTNVSSLSSLSSLRTATNNFSTKIETVDTEDKKEGERHIHLDAVHSSADQLRHVEVRKNEFAAYREHLREKEGEEASEQWSPFPSGFKQSMSVREFVQKYSSLEAKARLVDETVFLTGKLSFLILCLCL